MNVWSTAESDTDGVHRKRQKIAVERLYVDVPRTISNDILPFSLLCKLLRYLFDLRLQGGPN